MLPLACAVLYVVNGNTLVAAICCAKGGSNALSCILSYLHCKSWILRARALRSIRFVHGSEVIGSAAVTCSRRMSLKMCVFECEEKK